MTPLERLTTGLGLTRGDLTVALFLAATALSGFLYTRLFESSDEFRRRVGMARLLAVADSISEASSRTGLAALADSTTPPWDPISRDEAIAEGTDGEGPVELTLEDVAPIDLNAAPEEILQLLPGVGEKTAAKIVAARPFTSIDDLLRVHGIGPKKLLKMRPYIVAGGGPVAPKETGNRGDLPDSGSGGHDPGPDSVGVPAERAEDRDSAGSQPADSTALRRPTETEQ